MLQPTRTKYRKAHKGRIHGNATRASILNYGQFGLKAIEPDRIIGVKVWIYKGEVFNDKPKKGNKDIKNVTTNKNKI